MALYIEILKSGASDTSDTLSSRPIDKYYFYILNLIPTLQNYIKHFFTKKIFPFFPK